MKFILLLTFVALCYSYPYQYGNSYGGGRNVNINENGTIDITGADGKRITITRGAGVTGKRVDIAVSGPNIPTKRIQIDEQRESRDVNLMGENDEDYQRDKRSSKDSKRRSSQGDILTEILRQYQGGVDEQSYQQLLSKVDAAVQTGQLSRSIYEVLQSLGQGSVGQNQGLWTPQQQDILRQQIQNQGVTGNSLSRPYNVLDLLRRQVIQQQLQELQQQQQQQGYQTQGRYHQQGYYGAPVINALGQQQILTPYGQSILNPYETAEGKVIGSSVKEIVLEVPTVGGTQEIIEGVLLEEPQVVTYQNGRGFSSGIGGAQGATPTGTSWYNLLNSIYNTQGLQQGGVPWGQYGQRVGRYGQSVGQYGQQVEQYGPYGQYGQQVGQYGPYGQYGQYGQRVGSYGPQIGQYGQQAGQYGQQWGQIGQTIPAELSEIVEDEREILGQQRQIQQQQLQQEQLLEQGLQQQIQQQQQQQVQQQLLQQVLQHQQQQQQQQQSNIWRQYLLNGGSVQGGAQQGGLLQQQLGVYPQLGLNGGYVQQGQGTPIMQRYNVPWVL